jgi:hypothetical protein
MEHCVWLSHKLYLLLTEYLCLSYLLVFHGTYCTQTDGAYDMCVLYNLLTEMDN